MALLVGCSVPLPLSTGTTPAPTPPSNPPQPSYSDTVSISQGSVIVGTNTAGPMLVYSANGSGSPYAKLRGCDPAVDAQGNFYMFAFPPKGGGCGDPLSSIDVYPATAVGIASRIRSLPVGPGTKIANVEDMAVSPDGEIFVNDGNGVAVFSATANGADAPVRYIQWDGGGETPITPGLIAVDGKDNLYVQDGLSIAVFGPDDTGLVVPSRVISGPHTQLAGLERMTTDVQGNLYVTMSGGASRTTGVLEFPVDANGDAVPLRSVSSPMISNFDGPLGVAVDSSGLIYIRANDIYCGAIFEFAADASGNATPLSVLGGCATFDGNLDIDGTIAVF